MLLLSHSDLLLWLCFIILIDKLSEDNPISKFDATLFWDTKIENLNLQDDYFYIIKRIILRGDKKDRIVMFKNYDKQIIKSVTETSREIPASLKLVWLKALAVE